MNIIPFDDISQHANKIHNFENNQKGNIFINSKIKNFEDVLTKKSKKKIFTYHINKIQIVIEKSYTIFNKKKKHLSVFPKYRFLQTTKKKTIDYYYNTFKHKYVMVQVPRVILNHAPIVVGAKLPVKVTSVNIIISDDNRNIIFQKNVGPAKKGFNTFTINPNEIDQKYFSKDEKHPKCYNLNIVAKTDNAIIPSIVFSQGYVRDIFISSKNDVFVKIDELGTFSISDIQYSSQNKKIS
ncbi:hypothetical protein [Buchnera aphidicola]|uniref:hypothetical protein n=1 Tax=Buchnera aphidicola TaxID=9 RepID=UPI0034648700